MVRYASTPRLPPAHPMRMPSVRTRFCHLPFRALLDLDRALEVCSVFDDDLRRRQISVHRTVLLDLDLAFPTDITLHASYTITSPAMMSAVNFAVAPTVSFRSLIWTRPLTVPSMSRSSLPEISPFKCSLNPSRDRSRSAVAPAGPVASLLVLVVPSQDGGAGFGG